MTAAASASRLPPAVFDAGPLRSLDAGARAAVTRAGRIRELATGERIYADGDAADALFVVVDGAVELTAIRRGDDHPTRVRTARRGDSFGEEATTAGLCRRADARAVEPTRIVDIPASVFRRAAGRAGDRDAADRERRYLHRALIRDLLATSAFGRGIDDDDLDVLVDAARLERASRGHRIYTTGDPSDGCFVVVEGLVQIQRARDGRPTIQAYLARGDVFGDAELIDGRGRGADAVAQGDTHLIALPAAAVRSVSDRNPGLLTNLRRLAVERRDDQAGGLADAAHATQHVLHDLYRMQMARSLLVIDQDSCVRCGHCAWSCAEVHGQSRLTRRGDNIVARVDGGDGAASVDPGVPARLLIPSSCQHCHNAACMIDCPTGAIGRDVGGEVFIRESLCTGCGNCAKSCPWDNIAMGVRAPAIAGLSDTVAVKCDLCRDYDAPACVQACPTASIARLDPARDFADVRAYFGGAPAATATATRPLAGRFGARIVVAVAAAGAIAIAGAAFALHRAGAWAPGAGAGWWAGLLAGLLTLALTGYSIPKRVTRLWMRRRRRGRADVPHPATPRSRVRPHLVAHLALGAAACACVVGHTGLRGGGGPAGALHLGFWLTAILGISGGALYALVPRRLSRLERRGVLPEDLRAERPQLLDRLYRATSGASELLKTIASRLLVPYARAPLGGLALVASGRDLAGERRRLRARIDAMLPGRAHRLGGVDELIDIAVELRALPARRALTASLRGWLPLHVVTTAITLAMLLVHVLTAVLA